MSYKIIMIFSIYEKCGDNTMMQEELTSYVNRSIENGCFEKPCFISTSSWWFPLFQQLQREWTPTESTLETIERVLHQLYLERQNEPMELTGRREVHEAFENVIVYIDAAVMCYKEPGIYGVWGDGSFFDRHENMVLSNGPIMQYQRNVRRPRMQRRAFQTFLKGTHRRLGENSLIRSLPVELLNIIKNFFY